MGLSLSFVIYGALTPLLDVLGNATIDEPLRRLEERLFGTTLVEVVAPHATPEGVLFFGLVYALHAPLFFISPLLHWWHGRREQAERLLLTLALTMYAGFVGYALFPAYGPVGSMPELAPLPQNAVTQVVAEQGVALGTFPSLHAAICFAVTIDAWRTSLRWGVVFTVIAALIWCSTIYLRYHWVPDLIAGAVLALLMTWLVDRLLRQRAATPPR